MPDTTTNDDSSLGMVKHITHRRERSSALQKGGSLRWRRRHDQGIVFFFLFHPGGALLYPRAAGYLIRAQQAKVYFCFGVCAFPSTASHCTITSQHMFGILLAVFRGGLYDLAKSSGNTGRRRGQGVEGRDLARWEERTPVIFWFFDFFFCTKHLFRRNTFGFSTLVVIVQLRRSDRLNPSWLWNKLYIFST